MHPNNMEQPPMKTLVYSTKYLDFVVFYRKEFYVQLYLSQQDLNVTKASCSLWVIFNLFVLKNWFKRLQLINYEKFQ